MLQATKTHQEYLKTIHERTIRLGNKVPEGAVNLAYFSQPKNLANTQVLIANAPKQSIDHEQVSRVVHQSGLPSMRADHFDDYLLIEKDGYSGHLKRQSIEWQSETTSKERRVVLEEEYISVSEDIPTSKNHTEDGFSGTLLLQSKVLTPHTTEEVTKTEVDYLVSSRFFKVTGLTKPHYDFPKYYQEEGSETIFEKGYEGKLELDESTITYVKQTTQIPGQAVSKVVTYGANETIPSTIVDGEITLYLKTTETIVGEARYYGFSRYFGRYFGAIDEDGIYGEEMLITPFNEENKYVTDESNQPMVGRGHFSDKTPRIKPGIHRSSALTPMIEGVMPDYDTLKYTERIDGKEMMLDLSKSITGTIWADQWDKNQPFPPAGYLPIDGMSLEIETGLKPTLEKVNMGYFNEPFGRDAYYIPAITGEDVSEDQAWFRDIIVFYKDNEIAVKAYYVGYLDNGSVETYSASARYEGVLKKEETKTELLTTSWLCKASYAGVCYYNTSTYSGTAIYEGLVSKQLKQGNVEPNVESEFLMIPNSKGVLESVNAITKTRTTLVANEFFQMTPHFKDGEPLLYEGRSTYFTYYPHQVGAYEYYKENGIRLVNAAGRALSQHKKYQIKLKCVNEEESLYQIFVYTNFLVTKKQPVYLVYQAYDEAGSGALKTKMEYKEVLYTQPFMHPKQQYNVNAAIQKGYYEIQLNHHEELEDRRHFPMVSYVIHALNAELTSQPLTSVVINKNYALSKELALFNGRKYNLSPTDTLGRFLSPCDILIKDFPGLTDKQIADLKKDLFVIELLEESPVEGEEADVCLFINPNGTGVIEGETTQNTGIYNASTGKYDGKIVMDMNYQLEQGILKPIYYVKGTDSEALEVLAPLESEPLENWYPRVKYTSFTSLSTKEGGVPVRLTYSLPEYHQQTYSSIYGKPYVDVIGEVAHLKGEHLIQTVHQNLAVFLGETGTKPKNLRVVKVLANGTSKPLTITNWSFSEGLIFVEEVLNQNDNIQIDYTYKEEMITYRGFRHLGEFFDLDLNPNVYHSFKDLRYTDKRRTPVYELFHSIVYLFARPAMVEQLDASGEVLYELTTTNDQVLYHKIDDDTPESEEDLLIGSIYIRHNTSLDAVELIDTRSYGGGLITTLDDRLRHELEPESDYYWDIGFWDGEPFVENAVVVIRLDQRLLVDYGGSFSEAQIEQAVRKWLAFGVLPIIEYVATYTPEELPQASLDLSSELLEQTNETLELFAESQLVHQQLR